MPHPNFVLLYIDSPSASAAFYSRLLDKTPVESSPTFAMFALDSGVMLGLWATSDVVPAANPAGGSELAFAVDAKAVVDTLHATWRGLGLRVVQTPTEMDFGYTFVALDPDGHRLRVFAPSPQR